MSSPVQGLQFNREAAASAIAESIQEGDFVADIFFNNKVEPPVCHYIITREGSTEVLDWGQSFSPNALRDEARTWLASYALRAAS